MEVCASKSRYRSLQRKMKGGGLVATRHPSLACLAPAWWGRLIEAPCAALTKSPRPRYNYLQATNRSQLLRRRIKRAVGWHKKPRVVAGLVCIWVELRGSEMGGADNDGE